MGRHEDAGLLFEALIEAQPQSRDAWAALGVCLAALNQPEAALACQRQVLALSSATPPGEDPPPTTRADR